jgi:hypothetical protein
MHKILFISVFLVLGILLVYQFSNSEKIDTENTNSGLSQGMDKPVIEEDGSETSDKSEDINNDWLTYTNKELNYEFKYPAESKVYDEAPGYVGVSFMGEKQKSSGRTQTELFDGYAFNIADVTGEGYKDLDDFFKQKVEELKNVCTSIGDPEYTTIDGKKAIAHRLSCMNEYDNYYLLNGETFLEMSPFYVGDAEDLPRYEKTVKEIFSTFRFID